MSAVRPLRRIRAGVWRSCDNSIEFVGGRSITRGDDKWWDAYEVAFGESAEPLFFDRSPTLRDAVDRVERMQS